MKAMWTLFVAFAWLLKIVFWMPVLTIDLAEKDRVVGEPRTGAWILIGIVWVAIAATGLTELFIPILPMLFEVMIVGVFYCMGAIFSIVVFGAMHDFSATKA